MLNLLHIVTLFLHSVRSDALMHESIRERTFTVVVSFPGTKVHGNETSIIQDLDKGIKYSDKSEYFFHLGKAHIPNVLFRFGIGGEFLCCLR